MIAYYFSTSAIVAVDNIILLCPFMCRTVCHLCDIIFAIYVICTDGIFLTKNFC